MKRLLSTLLLLAGMAFGQSAIQSTPFTATGQGATLILQNSGIINHRLSWTGNGTLTTCQVRVDSSSDGVTWNVGDVIAAQTCTSPGSAAMTVLAANYIRVNVTTLTGGGTVTATYTGYILNPTGWQGVSGGSVSPTCSVITATVCIPVGGTGNTGVDGVANTATWPSTGGGSQAPWAVLGYDFNGGTWDRTRTASISNFPTSVTLTARNSIGAQLVEFGSRWSVTSAPAVGSQATASIALEATSRHVITGVCFSAGSVAAPAATSLQLNIRDGASGAGTVLATLELSINAAAGENIQPTCISGLILVGTTGTAATAEFNAGLANLKESVTLMGYNVN